MIRGSYFSPDPSSDRTSFIYFILFFIGEFLLINLSKRHTAFGSVPSRLSHCHTFQSTPWQPTAARLPSLWNLGSAGLVGFSLRWSCLSQSYYKPNLHKTQEKKNAPWTGQMPNAWFFFLIYNGEKSKRVMFNVYSFGSLLLLLFSFSARMVASRQKCFFLSLCCVL